MTHGGRGSKRRNEAARKAKRRHYWADGDVLRERAGFSEDRAREVAGNIFELTGRPYLVHKCRSCGLWHLQIVPRAALARRRAA